MSYPRSSEGLHCIDPIWHPMEKHFLSAGCEHTPHHHRSC